jgi:hypothetical protein
VDGERLHEINLSAEHLDRNMVNVMSTLCHEMVHYYCALNGIADTSQNGRYHNKNFKREAEARGLIISQAPSIGWSVTQPSPEFIEVIHSNGIVKPIDINRDGVWGFEGGTDGSGGGEGTDGRDGTSGAGNGRKKPKCSTRKYQCPHCKNSVRATKDLNILCGDCMIPFEKVEK